MRIRGGRPADAHLSLEHPLQACVHFIFLNELAPVGLFNAFPDGGTKAGILLKQAQRGILNQALGIGACLASNLRKLRFLLRCELDIHGLQVTRSHGLRQPAPATGTSGRGCLNGFGKSSPGNRQKRGKKSWDRRVDRRKRLSHLVGQAGHPLGPPADRFSHSFSGSRESRTFPPVFLPFSPETPPQPIDSSSQRRSVAFQAAMTPFVGAFLFRAFASKCLWGFPSHSTTGPPVALDSALISAAAASPR